MMRLKANEQNLKSNPHLSSISLHLASISHVPSAAFILNLLHHPQRASITIIMEQMGHQRFSDHGFSGVRKKIVLSCPVFYNEWRPLWVTKESQWVTIPSLPIAKWRGQNSYSGNLWTSLYTQHCVWCRWWYRWFRHSHCSRLQSGRGNGLAHNRNTRHLRGLLTAERTNVSEHIVFYARVKDQGRQTCPLWLMALTFKCILRVHPYPSPLAFLVCHPI